MIMQSWHSQIYKALPPPSLKGGCSDSEADDSDDDSWSDDCQRSKSRLLRPANTRRLPVYNIQSSLASESEEEDNRRYGLTDPEILHLSEMVIRGEDDEECCGGDLCKPSPSCIGVGAVAGVLVMFGMLICFMVIEEEHEEKQKLANMLSVAGGVTLVFCLLLCCCNSCVCCKKNLSHRPVSAPEYVRNILERRSSVVVPTIQIEAPSLVLSSSFLEEYHTSMEKVDKPPPCLDDMTVTTLCNDHFIVDREGDTSDDDNDDDLRKLEEGFVKRKNIQRDSIFTIDSYEMKPNSNMNTDEDDGKDKEIQSLRMLGTLSLFIEAIKSNNEEEKDSIENKRKMKGENISKNNNWTNPSLEGKKIFSKNVRNKGLPTRTRRPPFKK